MKDDAHETYIRAKQKAQHQVKIVLDQLYRNYGFRLAAKKIRLAREQDDLRCPSGLND